ncbi:hypothetical protein ACFL6I_13125 [candidate division KSB1 bacterium]
MSSQDLQEIAKAAARIYAGKDWHKLSEAERKLVKLLEEVGLIIPNEPANGSVGKIVPRLRQPLEDGTIISRCSKSGCRGNIVVTNKGKCKRCDVCNTPSCGCASC